ncbi:MAG TPA: tRNA pseudouridine(55) synthase TruB [Ideonella sp.]|uniref:tRNA pseudouridine(55) synthase TruB n=1 Tax=Ideonella sp. TaxID=1929293 RepID=UPI002CD456A4|nr:tRNA pseudouridine(55) synthase TruB [Ideonella sp.]HSI51276.1 tRNA pseudouridine(55) synthase TruB [Ideonella sp.]
MNSAKPRIPRRALHGVLLLDKPIGLSSNDALQKVKWLYRAEKAGHTGTLDPLATGLLPICFGAATKFSQVSLDADKGYLATLRLGQTTVGGDREGEILAERPVNVTGEQLLHAVASFLGSIDQIPPMQSALKKDGRALYEYARAGIEVERASRRVTIHRLDIVSWQPEDMLLTLDVRCSKGTYVRTLAQDLGEVLGCGAHLAGLRRTHSGGLDLSHAVTLTQLAEEDADARDARLQRPDTLLADWPALSLPDTEAARFLTGLRRRVALPDTPAVRVYGPQGAEGPLPRFLGPDCSAAFLGSGHILAGELIADRLLSPVEVQALLVS